MSQTPMFEKLEMDNPDAAKKPVFINNLSSNLIFLMELYGDTYISLSTPTDVPAQTLSDWANGKVKVQYLDHRLVKLAKHYGYTLEELVFGDLRNKHQAAV